MREDHLVSLEHPWPHDTQESFGQPSHGLIENLLDLRVGHGREFDGLAVRHREATAAIGNFDLGAASWRARIIARWDAYTGDKEVYRLRP